MVNPLFPDKNIKFLGYVKDRYKFFKSLSIFVFPSYSEGLGLVLLEAMSYGVLCIARDVAPMNKIINHEDNGYQFILWNSNIVSLISDRTDQKEKELVKYKIQ